MEDKITSDKSTSDKSTSDKITDARSDELKGILNVLQSKTFRFIFLFSCAGIMLIFAASIFNTEENKYYEVANAMNMFISIVVGIVAMVMSIISLFFSFYNTKQSYDTHDDYLEKFININNSLEHTMKKQEEYIDNFNRLSDKMSGLEDKMSGKFEKMYDMIQSLEKSAINQVEPRRSGWINNVDEDTWDFGNDNSPW